MVSMALHMAERLAKNLELSHHPLPATVSKVKVKGIPYTTKLQCSRIDAFDMWALRKILRIPYTRHVTNVEVRATTGCRPLSNLVTDRRLRLWTYCPQLTTR